MKHPRTSPKKTAYVREVLACLQASYGAAPCALNHRNAFELLAATILSAQCTDVRVNLVTPALFAAYPNAAALAAAELTAVEALVHTTGFFRAKARSLVGMAGALMADHGGAVPEAMEALLALPGVARKTANVVRGVGFGVASGVVVDTHVSRLAQRLGLSQHPDAKRIEVDLMAALPPTTWIATSLQLIAHGRAVCTARRPRCGACTLAELCPAAATGGALPLAAAATRRRGPPSRPQRPVPVPKAT